jgi:inhibitor of KinA sporulation pathway (predicted exonuclease)
MNYIILDLEWNQSARGKDFENKELPFEIIQIGAVKLDEKGDVQDIFNCVVRPSVYKKLHSAVKEVVALTDQELKSGVPFSEAFIQLMKFCEDDYIFCTWGSQDLWQLQQNMQYYHIENAFPKVMKYYDVQKLFSIVFEDGKLRRTVEHAVDVFGLEKDLMFHSAVNDARYVAKIFKSLMENKEAMDRVSVDYFKQPLCKKDEVCLRFKTYSKYVYRVFPSKEEAMEDKGVLTIKCPICRTALRKKVMWFTGNSKKYYCVAKCPFHGFVRGKIQMKKYGADPHLVFPIKIVKPISEEDVEKICEMKRQVTEKRRLKRMKQGS